MQHLDEGTIHAWLDGALSTDDAARAEAHVKECAQCQAAVANARGFIAASSRILTALDNAPRGVIPATTPARRVQPWIWRVAATVLVVATGTVLLVQRRGSERDSSTEAPLSVPQTQATKLDKVTDSAGTAAASQITAQPGIVGGTAAASAPRTFSASPQNAPTRRASGRDMRARESAPVTTQAPIAPAAAPEQLSGVVGEAPMKVGTKRAIGKTETFYEIAPGDTVVLEEQSPGEPQNIAAAGAATSRAQPMLRSNKAAAVAEAQQKTQSAVPAAAPTAVAPPVAALQDVQGPDIHRISWLDPTTGSVVILSGRHSQEELQEIRKKIQRIRDAAEASKKLPE